MRLKRISTGDGEVYFVNSETGERVRTEMDKMNSDVSLNNVTTQPTKESGFFGPEKKSIKKGVMGGIFMMVIAVIWFIVGYSLGIIFYYPPILFFIGVYALIKGLVTGNISGDKILSKN